MSLAPGQFPRLLAGMPSSGALGLAAHQALHGPLTLPPRQRSRTGHPLILELERAGLRGYGGAGFPTATKLHAVGAQGSPPTILVNGAEGEPLSSKDLLLTSRLPHLVIDGVLAAASVLGSDRVIFALDEHARGTARALQQALAERRELQHRGAPAVTVNAVPGGYLTGQEMALVNVLDGGEAKPTTTPPYPFERGLKGRPTLVSNSETFAQLALVARHGADWFRTLGTATDPGTRLVTVGGAVSYPGVVEIAGGTTLKQLIGASGGLAQPIQGVLLGGYAGTWLPADALDLRLDAHMLLERGLRLGSGIVVLLPESACIVAEVASVARWLQGESAHQCGPCINGLQSIADALEELCARGDRRRTYGRIERWCELVIRRGACSLPDGAASFVTSALRTFRPLFEDHARHGACDACVGQRVLPTATVDPVYAG
ncbi:MAG TPA: NADH-ubiquinone oxidoreductase-F iron-sulfur binding region domain-containing protein [Solirubrobacteraceae bacterium]|jgi:NADH:ubiquinone oxidoreductase subunit F (NADH-binding)|nr:NADH-ubiquinone oxidoreductase-F iron-sulfur binding region domain-containing protein [Solirubrobacteraceae bacterium]